MRDTANKKDINLYRKREKLLYKFPFFITAKN